MSELTTQNLWAKAPTPLMMLAPMEDVTDTAFRQLIMQISAPGHLHIVFTEFTSTDGLCHPQGRKRVEERLLISQEERNLLQANGIKIIAQIWGNNPEKYSQAIRYIDEQYKFDGIDINMGCPVRNVVAQGSCSALIDNEPLAAEIIAAAKEATQKPLSVKTRLGVKKTETERWISFLLNQPIEAIILHGRIQKQMSEGSANWAEIAKAVTLRNQISPHIRIIGNGDILSYSQALEYCENYGTDGAMIGRGIFTDPWLFNPTRTDIPAEEKLSTLLNHLSIYEHVWGETKPFVILRRFFKIYLSNFNGASHIRAKMMQAASFEEARQIIDEFTRKYSSMALEESNV